MKRFSGLARRAAKSPGRVGVTLFALLGLVGATTGCAPQERTLTVLAAASLTESFDQIGERFQRRHPDVEVTFDYQGSSTLAEQLNQGRQADVFASANPENMDKVEQATGVTERSVFARNQLTLAVPEGNPANVGSLSDLAGKTVVVCAPEVPCGVVAEEAEQKAGVTLRPASEENDVKAVARKVSSGEADAGLVYATDVRSSDGALEEVEMPEVSTSYPIAVPEAAAERELASEFISFVRGEEGQRILREHGFAKP